MTMTLEEWRRIMGAGNVDQGNARRSSKKKNSGHTCMARTRSGTPCKRMSRYTSGRCALHGGLSTGPKTPQGKERSSRNGPNGRRGNQTP
ncbi:MAG: hypothetical protein CVU71_06555 [Deltaproteobacteria bacterium HGW-Deltaproteobacteria-6]|jgi:hypothetical protein|nr:MAG: hypothetical protein CVU71_06555 [Deltaproteobacteria bacterium HGW-Deltaproteobacteria-6]